MLKLRSSPALTFAKFAFKGITFRASCLATCSKVFFFRFGWASLPLPAQKNAKRFAVCQIITVSVVFICQNRFRIKLEPVVVVLNRFPKSGPFIVISQPSCSILLTYNSNFIMKHYLSKLFTIGPGVSDYSIKNSTIIFVLLTCCKLIINLRMPWLLF